MLGSGSLRGPYRRRHARPVRAGRVAALAVALALGGSGVAVVSSQAFGVGTAGRTAATAKPADSPAVAPPPVAPPDTRASADPAQPSSSAADATPTRAAATTAPAKRPATTVAPRRAGTTTKPPSTSAVDEVLALVNSERTRAGCGAVSADAKLALAASRHSADMAARGYFSHVTPEGVTLGTRVSNAGYRWSALGENIAKGQPTPASVMRAWMNSDGHRANILNCRYRHLGVGLAYEDGRTPVWTQDFGTPA